MRLKCVQHLDDGMAVLCKGLLAHLYIQLSLVLLHAKVGMLLEPPGYY